MVKKTGIGIFILFILIGVINLFVNLNSNTISREKITSTEIKSKEIDIGIELEKEVKEGNAFASTITIPITNIEKIDQEIREWAVLQEDLFFSEIKEMDPRLSKRASAEFIIEPIVKRVKKEYLTYEMKVHYKINDESTETDKQLSYINSFVINSKEDEFVEITDILSIPEIENESEFTRLLSILPEGKQKKTLEDSNIQEINSIQWLLSEKHLEFIINPIEKSKEKDRVAIKYSKIRKHMNDPYKKQFAPKKKKPKPKKEKTNKNLVALTFDDGPDNEITPKILETLKKYDVKATFFMLGKSVIQYPELAKEVGKQGHEIANHSETHRNLNKSNQATINNEVIESKKIIKNATGIEPKLFRPPYGEYNQAVLNASNNSNQEIIMWSVDTLDWQHKNKNKTVDIVMKNVQPNSIILMHDIHGTTADALPSLIEKLQKEGYELVTTSELIKHLDPQTNGVYYGK